MTNTMIEAVGLHKSFGETQALIGLDFDVREGTILGMLGPNGAGKTTAVRILTTLTHPNSGSATVAGIDVLRHPARVRSQIGVAGQYAALDELLTGRENLGMVGRLYRIDGPTVKKRADALLERFELTDAAHRTAKTYSGGMRRRLDLGASLVGRPQVLFLDEPTTGLDPRSRLEMWDIIRELVKEGTTLLLTTQYLEEADRLANKIAVIDLGRVIAEGTSDELKARVGGEVLALRVADRDRAPDAAGADLGLGPGGGNVDNNTGEINVPVGTDGTTILTEAVRRLDAEGIRLADVGLRRPTLDDVFLGLTGHAAESGAGEDADGEASGDGDRKSKRKRKKERERERI